MLSLSELMPNQSVLLMLVSLLVIIVLGYVVYKHRDVAKDLFQNVGDKLQSPFQSGGEDGDEHDVGHDGEGHEGGAEEGEAEDAPDLYPMSVGGALPGTTGAEMLVHG